MTSRRSFFKSLGLIASAVSASPLIFLPKFEPVRWKRILDPENFAGWAYYTEPYIFDAIEMRWHYEEELKMFIRSDRQLKIAC